MQTAIVSVINDLSTDQRVHKTCTTLHNLGFKVTLVGRKQRKSIDLATRVYETKRMFLLFEKGALFYAEYQLRLFLYLILKKSTILVSNDLDTLLPNYIASILKNVPLVYDTHEVFCEVPELQNNPIKKKIWKCIERWIFPKLKHIFTVNDSISKLYSKEYGVKINVVRNVPFLKKQIALLSKEHLNLPNDKKIIVLQGAGINVDRGAEEAVEAMQYVNNAILLIIGSGDVIEKLQQMVVDFSLQNKVQFVGKVPLEKLLQYTQLADLGITLDKDTNINYRYSLPNKLFDYIHAGVPILASNLIEIKTIIDKYAIGDCISSHDPQDIASKINEILSNPETLVNWKKNTKIAASEMNWEMEEQQLIKVYKQFL